MNEQSAVKTCGANLKYYKETNHFLEISKERATALQDNLYTFLEVISLIQR